MISIKSVAPIIKTIEGSGKKSCRIATWKGDNFINYPKVFIIIVKNF